MDQSVQPPFAIRPMGVGEVIDAGIRLTRGNYRLLLRVMAYGIVPSFILGVISSAAGVSSTQLSANLAAQSSGALALYGVLEVAIGLVTAIAEMAVVLACSRLIEDHTSPDELTVSALFSESFRRLGWLILLGLVGVLLAVPLVIIFPLGIFLAVRWSQAFVVLVIERTRPVRSLGRSWNLTKGSWWHVLGVIVVASILLVVLESVVGGIFGAIGGILTFTGSPFAGGVVTTLGVSLISLLLTPFSLAIYTVLYYELRARREGFDLEMRGRQLPGS